MTSRSFTYSAPQTVADAVAMLAQTPGSRPLAGGHELLTRLRLRNIDVPHLVDLRNIKGLREITAPDGGPAVIGAMVTLAELARHAGLRQRAGALVEAADSVGDVQTRNAATIGGSLATDEGANDIAAALLALEAVVHLSSGRGSRVISCADLCSSPAGALHQDGELIVSIEIPPLPAAAGTAYAKFKNPANNYPLCGVAAVVSLGSSGKIDRVRLAVTGATARPTRLTPAEAKFAGLAPDGAADQIQGIIGDLPPVSDMFAGGDYRSHLADVVAADAIKAAIVRITAGT